VNGQPTDEVRGGFFQDLGDLFLAPADAFASLLTKNQFWIPMILVAVIAAGCAGLWASKADPVVVVRSQMEDMGLWEKIPPEQQATMLADAPKGFAAKQVGGALLVPPIMYVVFAALFLAIYRFAMDGAVTFRQSLTVVCWGSLAVTLVGMPLALLVLWLKGDWNIPIQNALNANLTLALSRGSTSKFLYSVAASLDLFSFWALFLYATGFAVAAKRKFSWAIWGVTIPWAVYVLAKSGLASLF
jgi:hypothetical protein